MTRGGLCAVRGSENPGKSEWCKMKQKKQRKTRKNKNTVEKTGEEGRGSPAGEDQRAEEKEETSDKAGGQRAGKSPRPKGSGA